MKVFFKIILGLLLFAALGYGLFQAYKYTTRNKQLDTIDVIPSDAIFIVETSNLTKGWKAVSESSIWAHLMNNEMFADINESIGLVDDLLAKNSVIDMMLKNRKLMFSAHMTSGVDYDFVFVVEAIEMPKMSVVKSALELIDGYTLSERNYMNTVIIELHDNATGDVIYLSKVGSLIIGSFTGSLLEKSIAQSQQEAWNDNRQFLHVASSVRNNKLFNFYFNYKQLEKFMSCYMDDPSSVADISAMLAYSAFEINLEDEKLSFNGFTNTDSVSSYLRALSKVAPGKARAHEIMSSQTAIYIAMCFENYADFQKMLVKEFADENSADYESYAKNISRIEKLVGVNLQENLFNWIGSEIAFFKMNPEKETRLEDVVAAFQAKDIDAAQAGLSHILEQVAKRSPMQYEENIYKNFQIQYLDINNFFTALFGKMFAKLGKPYFAYIEDYVVFSNSEAALKQVIDDYIIGNTLSRRDDFMAFKDNFSVKSNLSVFVQMPRIYANLRYFADNETRKDIETNRDLILSFARIGFQLISEDGTFRNELIAEHDPSALMDEETEDMEVAAYDNLFTKEFDTLGFKPLIPKDSLLEGIKYILTYPDESTAFECPVKKGMLDGIAKSYYESGNLKSTVPYSKGIVNGDAVFYYDTPARTRRAEMHYKDEVLSGIYKEFYDNGAQKATLLYDNGLLDDEAKFFYPSGALMIEGLYKKGKRNGKWKFYTEEGELYTKEKWRKGELSFLDIHTAHMHVVWM